MVESEYSKGSTAPPSTKYDVAHSDTLGRYLVAAKNLAPGEVILREYPAVVGPAAFFTGNLCFGCLRPLQTFKAHRHVCSKCNVAPLCNSSCEDVSGYHKLGECQLFQNNKDMSTIDISDELAILLPLRMWLLKTTDSQVWEKIDNMEAHTDERRDTSVWTDREENVIQVLQRLNLVPNEKDTTEVLQRLCGILDVNSFELRSPEGSENHLLRGIYTEAALMAHDCRGNTHLTVDDKHRLTIYASLPIMKGENISFNYTASLLGSAERRENLRQGKYFECICSLCKDPYELGSHLSSVVCPRCRKGFIAMQKPLETKAYGLKTKWQCHRCKWIFAGAMIKTTLGLTRSLIEESESNNAKELEALLKKLLLSFHKNHFLVLELKQKLLTGYKRETATANPQRKTMQRMLDLCKEIFDVLEIVEPGISRQKGIILYEMHLPMAILANRAFAAHEISLVDLVSRLEEAANLLRNALSMLFLEPASTPEGRLAKHALKQLKVLTQSISDAKSLPADAPAKRQLQRKTRNEGKL